MSYNILGINFSHNGSVCVLKNGKIDFFLEEDRLTRIKHDSFPLKLLEYIATNFSINEIAIAGLYHYPFPSFKDHHYSVILDKFFPTQPKTSYLNNHHLTHAFQSFTNSKFDKCLSIVVDGSGTEILSDIEGPKYETESIYQLSYTDNPIPIYKSYRTNTKSKNYLTFSKVYECITHFLGFGFLQAGKTMGLSSYGKNNSIIPKLYFNTRGNPEVFDIFLNTTEGDLKEKYKMLLSDKNIKADLAYHLQQESQNEIGDLLEQAINKTNIKQICCSGGYFLNCVTNYYLTKRFPDVQFYFEPISSEAGVAIGAAKLLYHQKNKLKNNFSQKTLYYGPKYSTTELLKTIGQYLT